MKYTVAIIVSVILMMLTNIPLHSEASYLSEVQEEISSEAEDILSEYDIGLSLTELAGMSFHEICSAVIGDIRERIVMPIRIFGTVLVLSVLSQLMEGISGKAASSESSDITSLVTALISSAVIAAPLVDLYSRSLGSIRMTASFTLVYIPVFTAITALSGCIASAGAYHLMILGASEILIRLCETFLLPVLSICTVLAFSGCLFNSAPGSSIVKCLRKTVTAVMSSSAILFTGFLSIRCTLAGSTDSAADKTARMLLSGSVPVIGGAVSDAYSTVKGSLGVIRSTVGTAGVIAIMLILLPPLAEIILYRIAIWAGTSVAEILQATSISSLTSTLDGALALVQCVMVSQCGILIICTAIFMSSLS